MSRAFGLEVTELEYDWGEKADNDEVAEALANDPEIKAAICVLSETSTGTVNDIEGFARAAAGRRHHRRCGLGPWGLHFEDRRMGCRRRRRRLAEGAHDAAWPGIRER